ncbi:unnamed protein product [Cylindrotheca closterium]|uniref:Signal recognition particle receptor subunit beta n=1 Tax=Cylindrotheca closterium TaxID=2856 RepID=A0AAD2G6U2_9STRA|nr:unnamed protein product [Cylindrotheca closterium]
MSDSTDNKDNKKKKNNNMDQNDNPDDTVPSSMVTTMKQHITPYLPPPVVAAMAKIDPPLEPFLGPEPSMTLIGTLGLGFIVWKVLSLLLGGGGGTSTSSGSAIQDDDQDDATNPSSKNKSQRSFDSTLVFCGPSLAGKTSMFYKLLYPQRPFSRMGTVQSLSSNVGYKQHSDVQWRYLDVPGHWGADKLVSTVLKQQQNMVQRIVLVVDSTQPVSKAADYLYALLQYQQQQQQQASKSLTVLIACHKAKAPKAKNFRRIKLNLRNELERLEKLSSQPTKIQDWEDALSSFEFCSSSVDPPLLQDIESFCESGKLSK